MFKDEKVRFSLILDTDQDDLDGKIYFIKIKNLIDAENIAKTQDFDMVDKKIKKLQRKVITNLFFLDVKFLFSIKSFLSINLDC